MTELVERIRQIKGPRPLLSKRRENELTTRQREILDELGSVFDKGFNHLTMADLASRMGCSLRTLYGLADSRDELVLLVVDRNLWRVGRTATNAVVPGMTPLEAIRDYLTASHMAVADTTPEFAHDCAALTATRELNRAHATYLMHVTRSLLDAAAEQGEIGATVDTAAVARVVAGLGAHFASPSTLPTINTSPKEAADGLLAIILSGLASSRDSKGPQ